MNIREYNAATGTTNSDERRVLKTRFPRYDRSTHSMVTHPEDYGVELTDEAQELLVSVFGPGPGLGQNPRQVKRVRKSDANRSCPHRYYFRLDEKTAAGFALLMKDKGFSTVQDFVSSLITGLVAERKETDAER